MSSNEVWATCGDCGEELKQSDKQCPRCGSTKKAFERKASTVIGLKTSGESTHKPKWSSEQYALFFGLGGMLFALVVSGILTLLPFGPVVNYGILLGVLLIAFPVYWWNRYKITMLLRRLGRKFGGEKKSKI